MILWASPWGAEPWEDEQALNDILSRFKEDYAHLLVLQARWSLEAIALSSSPDDQITFLVNFLDLEHQREATRAEYIRCVPEGSRYLLPPAHKFWVLNQVAWDYLYAIEKRIRDTALSTNKVFLILLHRQDRPLLDFPLIRKAFPKYTIHHLPIIVPDSTEVVAGEASSVSLSIHYSHRPALARGRIIRDLTQRQVGLALGGGGARGLAHIGVIRALEAEGIPIDMVAGSSFGSVVAAAYGVGRTAQRLYDDMKFHWSKLGNFLLDIMDYHIPRTSLLRGRKIRHMIEIAMADQTIEECPIPIFVVCTDLITGREIVLDHGKLGKAIWASGSLPGIFQPVRWGKYLLVDGAVLNKVPAQILHTRGARIIIAVNVTPERDTGMENHSESNSWFKRQVYKIPYLRNLLGTPNIMRIISRSMSISGLHQSRIHQDTIDVEIKPRIEDFDFLRFDQYDEIVEAGAEATRQVIPQIRELLK